MVKAARKQAKLTQAELAKRVGVSQQLWSDWETGKVPLTPANAMVVSKALGIDVVRLLVQVGDDAIAASEAKDQEISRVNETMSQMNEKLDGLKRMIIETRQEVTRVADGQEALEEVIVRLDEKPSGRPRGAAPLKPTPSGP